MLWVNAAFTANSIYIPGKKENLSGLEYLKNINDGNNAQLAFDNFKESSELGFAKGQVNLAQMYLTILGRKNYLSRVISLYETPFFYNKNFKIDGSKFSKIMPFNDSFISKLKEILLKWD